MEGKERGVVGMALKGKGREGDYFRFCCVLADLPTGLGVFRF